MVFQNYALYPHLSVYDNIGFSLEMRKVPKADRDAKVRDAAEALGLTDMLDRKPRQLSGGQRQRVAMGRAIVREPSVFLMDEPLSNLDAKLRVQMRSEVLRVHRRLAVATLYVTHDQTEAMTMGDRVVVLRDGVLQQCAAPRELYQAPDEPVCGHLHRLTVDERLPGSAGTQPTTGRPSCSVASASRSRRRSWRARPSLSAYLGRKLIVGLRPEHLTDPAISAQPPAPGTTLVADVDLVEALGSEELAHFSIDAPLAQQGSKASAHVAAELLDGIIAAWFRVRHRSSRPADRHPLGRPGHVCRPNARACAFLISKPATPFSARARPGRTAPLSSQLPPGAPGTGTRAAPVTGQPPSAQ